MGLQVVLGEDNRLIREIGNTYRDAKYPDCIINQSPSLIHDFEMQGVGLRRPGQRGIRYESA